MQKILCFASSLLAASAVFAQPTASQPTSPRSAAVEPRVSAKPVTRAEYLARAAQYFDQLDTDRNGEISREERLAMLKPRQGERPGQVTAGKDGPRDALLGRPTQADAPGLLKDRLPGSPDKR